ncbi:hypothetical protein J3F83DRAFT_190945 [Trichoderma novae-zelandiae]
MHQVWTVPWVYVRVLIACASRVLARTGQRQSIRALLHGRLHCIQSLCRVTSAQEKGHEEEQQKPLRGSEKPKHTNTRIIHIFNPEILYACSCAASDWLKAPNSCPTPASCQGGKMAQK